MNTEGNISISRRVRQAYSSWRFRRAFHNDLRTLHVAPKVMWSVQGQASFECNSEFAMLGAKWPGLECFDSRLKLAHESAMILNGNVQIFSGFLITVNEGSVFEMASGYINYRSTIECFKEIRIGANTIIGPDVTIRDSDNHSIMGQKNPATAPIRIGKKCWIGSKSIILKGVELGDGCVVAAGAVVTRSFPPKTLVGGVPARVIRTDVDWQ